MKSCLFVLATAILVSSASATDRPARDLHIENPLVGWRTLARVSDGAGNAKHGNRGLLVYPTARSREQTPHSQRRPVTLTQRVVEPLAGFVAGTVVGTSLVTNRNNTLGVRLMGRPAVFFASLSAPIAHGLLRDRMGPIPSLATSALGSALLGVALAGTGRGFTAGTFAAVGVFSAMSGLAAAGTVELIRRFRGQERRRSGPESLSDHSAISHLGL